MMGQKVSTDSELDLRLSDRMEAAWAAMPSKVRFALRRRSDGVGSLNAIKEIGRHFHGGQRSIMPLPELSTFGELGRPGSTEILKRLRGYHD